MKVTVIGAGNTGSTFAEPLVRAGHEVGMAARAGADGAGLGTAIAPGWMRKSRLPQARQAHAS